MEISTNLGHYGSRTIFHLIEFNYFDFQKQPRWIINLFIKISTNELLIYIVNLNHVLIRFLFFHVFVIIIYNSNKI